MSGGTRWGPTAGNRTLYSVYSTTDSLTAATISTTETVFATSYTFPANYIDASKTFRITVMVNVLGTATIPTSILRMRFRKAGPTDVNLYQSTALAYQAGTLGYGGHFFIQGTAAAGASVNIMAGVVGDNINGPFGRNVLNTLPVAIDTASAQTLQFTQQFSSNSAGNTVTLAQLIIEELG